MTKLRRTGLWLPKRAREILLTRERPSKWDDMRELSRIHMETLGTWKQQMQELWIDGVPTNIAGGLAGIEAGPIAADYPTITIGATELSLWTPQTHCPVAGLLSNAPKVYQLDAFGVATSAATPGTETINPRVDVVGGTSFNATGTTNITPTASSTAAPWWLQGRLIFRGPTGSATATATAIFTFMQSNVVGGGGTLATGTPQIFGGAAITWDNTALKGLWMGLTATTSTTNTKTPRGVLWGSWN